MKTADKYVQKRVIASLARHEIATYEGGTVQAYVNHGRWVADCPCNGSELVAPGLPMTCGSCGAEHKVSFPRSRKAIEAALEPREGRLQNWLPGETPADLWAQNIDHGIFPDDFKAGA